MPPRETTPRIRPATHDDLSFILSLVPRLVAFDISVWGDAEAIHASSDTLLREELTTLHAGTTVLVAETQNGKLSGFVHLDTTQEFFTGESQGYIANLAVAQTEEGRGIGRALMAAAEKWTKEQGMRHLTLYVFASNVKARTLYASLDFEEDSLKLVKEVTMQ